MPVYSGGKTGEFLEKEWLMRKERIVEAAQVDDR